jgi:Protein of unknown function (DUF3147)
MIVSAKLSALKEGRWYEYVIRFALGGATTLAAGIIGDIWGPATGGLFLAFPAILCASITLVESHERREKRKHNVAGCRRGTDAAALEASGAAIGSVGLGAFALAVWLLVPAHGLTTLVIASIGWVVVSFAGWRLHQHIRHLR